MIPMMDMFFNPNSATSKAAAKTSQTHGTGDMDAGGALFKNLIGDIPGMGMGDPTAMAPAGEEGWKTAVQPEGSMFATTPEGAFAGFNPKVSHLGKAMQGAAAQMPGGPAMPTQEAQPQMRTATPPPRPEMGAFSQPASWLKPFQGA